MENNNFINYDIPTDRLKIIACNLINAYLYDMNEKELDDFLAIEIGLSKLEIEYLKNYNNKYS